MTPELIIGDCPHCQGEGHLLAVGPPGSYSARLGNYLPSEDVQCCPACDGSGELELCARCREPLRVLRGLEVCGCMAEEMQQAA